MSKFNLLLSDFGNTIGIPDLKADSSGICMLAFDDIEVVIQHIQDGDMLLLYGYLGPIPPDNQELLFEHLLTANSFFRDTGGSTIGIDKTTNAIGLHIAYPIQALDNQLFENLLENFVNMAESWIEKIDRFPAILHEGGSIVSASPFQQSMNKSTPPPSSNAPVPPAGGKIVMPPAGGRMASPPPNQGRPAVPPSGSPQAPVGGSRPGGHIPPPPPGLVNKK